VCAIALLARQRGVEFLDPAALAQEPVSKRSEIRSMKRLFVVSMATVLAAGSAGCVNCFQRAPRAARPCVPMQCAPSPCCTPGAEVYTTPGTVTTVPSLSAPGGAPMQVMPGPEQYTVPAQ